MARLIHPYSLIEEARRRGKKLLHLWEEIIITLVGIFHVYYTCGKLGVTFVGNLFITLVGNFITLGGFITVVGNFITLVGVITSRKFYYTCGSDTPITSQHCFWMSIHWIYMWIGNVSFYVVRYLLCDCLFVDTGHESWHWTLISRNIKSNTHSNVADLLLSWPLSTSFEADKAVGSSTELPLCIPARLSDAVPTSSPPSTLKLLWRAEEETKVLITIHQIFILCQYGNTSDRETSCKIEYMHH